MSRDQPSPVDVLIVDDEPPARQRLERLVKELRGCWRVVGSCASAGDALIEAARLRPGIVLLDIRMPGMCGLEAARHLARSEAPPAVIFTTAYDVHALEAFDSQAVGYLLKPVRRERLAAALAHAARLSPALGDARGAPPAERHIAVRVRDEVRLIPLDEILYFRAEQKYVTVRHAGGDDLLDEPLKQLEDSFPDRFVRIHRSLLVAIDEVEALERAEGGGPRVRLRRSGERLPVSRRQLGELKRRLRIN